MIPLHFRGVVVNRKRTDILDATVVNDVEIRNGDSNVAPWPDPATKGVKRKEREMRISIR